MEQSGPKNYYGHVDEAMKNQKSKTALHGEALDKVVRESEELAKKSGSRTAFGGK